MDTPSVTRALKVIMEERMVILILDTLDPSIPASTPDMARGVLTMDTDTDWLLDMDTLDHTVLSCLITTTTSGDTNRPLDTASIRLTLDTVDPLSMSPGSTLDSPTPPDTEDTEATMEDGATAATEATTGVRKEINHLKNKPVNKKLS